MKNKNSKSESYIVKEAENIIDTYLSKRELGDIENYNKLKRKYKKLKIIIITIAIANCISMLINII